MQIMQLKILIQRSGRQVYKHKTKERYIRWESSNRGWTVGRSIKGGNYFSKTLKNYEIPRFSFLPYDFIPTENFKADDDEPWITPKFLDSARNPGGLDIDCA